MRPAREAQQAGIPVIIGDSDLDWDGRVSFVATDNKEGGRMGGEKLAELIGGEGKVILMRYLENSASTTRRAGSTEVIWTFEIPLVAGGAASSTIRSSSS